jgi:lysophospholipase L1-like esterase
VAFEAALLRLSEGAESTVLLQICARDEYADAMARAAAVSPSTHHLVYEGDTVDGCHPTAEGHAQLAEDVLALGL